MKLVGGIASHVGNVRDVNQDRAFFGESLAAVADGMGGHQGGEIAAQVAVSRFDGLDGPIGCDELLGLVSDSNSAVFEKAIDPELRGMGPTLVVLALQPEGDLVTIANVGDSRAYHYLDGTLRQITVDHSLVQDLVTAGKITEEEAHVHPQRNIVTRALGISPTVEADSFTLPAKIGDRYLLCSDGLINEVDEPAIAEILEEQDAVSAANSLVQAAINEAGRDNVTVAVVDIVEGDLETAAEDTGEFDADPTLPLNTAQLAEADTDESLVLEELDDDNFDDVAANGLLSEEETAELDLDSDEVVFEDDQVNDADPGFDDEADEFAGDDFEDAENEDASVPVVVDDLEADEVDESELAESAAFPGPVEPAPKRGLGKLIIAGLAAAAILVATFFSLTWYVENSWYLDEADGKVAIYNGRPGGFLWFGSEEASVSDVEVADLDEASKRKVDENLTVGSRSEAERALNDLTEKENEDEAADESPDPNAPEYEEGDAAEDTLPAEAPEASLPADASDESPDGDIDAADAGNQIQDPTR